MGLRRSLGRFGAIGAIELESNRSQLFFLWWKSHTELINQTRNLLAHLTMLADLPSHLHTISLATNFLDYSLLTAVGKLGRQGVLRHLKLETGGTNLKVDGVKELMSSCIGLESFILNDVEGESDVSFADSRSIRQEYLEDGGKLATQSEED